MRFYLLAVVAAGLAGGPALAAEGGVGAMLPYLEVQAEDAATDGAVLPVDYAYNTLAAEASGRSAVTLSSGQHVDFKVPAAASSIVVRYSIPDAPDGVPYTAPLALLIDGVRQPDLTLTTAYSHYYGAYPFSNGPKGGNHHHFYDDVSARLPQMQPGAVVRLQLLDGSAREVTIDLADFEQVPPPLEAPPGALVFVADNTGQTNVTNKLRQAVEDAEGGTLFIPPGTYLLKGNIPIKGNVTIQGAGMWHTILDFDNQGANTGFLAARSPGPATANVVISDIRMNGNIQERVDSGQSNAFSGMIADSTIRNVWAEHFKVGAWLVGPAANVTFSGVRFRDLTADGINFNSGYSHSTVTRSHFRNTGDDALAMWSQLPDTGNTFSFNTVELPILANGIAIYGGADNTVSDNRIVDAGLTQGGGIHVGNRFGAPALSGTTTIVRNTIVRSGSMDPNWHFGVGSLWFDARDEAMTGKIEVTDLLIRQAPYSAVMFVSGEGISNVSVDDMTVEGAGTFVVQAQVPGGASFRAVAANNIGAGGVWNCASPAFALADAGGNGDWIDNIVACTEPQPSPIFPLPVPNR